MPRWIMWALLAAVGVAVLWVSTMPKSASQIKYSQLVQYVDEGKVDSLKWDNSTGEITGEYKGSAGSFSTTGPAQSPDSLRTKLDKAGVNYSFDSPTPGLLESLLPLLLPVLLIVGLFWWMQRRATGQMGGVMSIGRSKAKTYNTERPGTTFDDVAGYEGVKREITEIVDFLREPDRFAAIGARIPKGVLLVGPPGTGKTLIARAVAGEAGVPFMSVTGSDFMEMFVGVGASRVRDMFESARKLGRAIIFIDEIDSIGRKRGAGLGGGHDEREQTLNQMLAEMDGFEDSTGIVMIAATNRPDILDPALLRPGRFDRQVVVPLPELADRRKILAVHVRGKKVANDVELDLLARMTPGMSGADLANLVNEAALFAVRGGHQVIGMQHFEEARDRVLMGAQRDSMVLSDEEKEAIAYHESGHAVCAAVLPETDPLHKVTIIPAGMALGVTMTLPDTERHLYRMDYFEDRLVMMMGGRVAEEIVFGKISNGASDDLVRATEIAHTMVREWGMSERVGPMAWRGQDQVFLGESLMGHRDYSDETARIIDEETARILVDARARCHETLMKHRNGLDLVARALLEHETIDGSEVERLLELGQNVSASSDPSTTADVPPPVAATPPLAGPPAETPV